MVARKNNAGTERGLDKCHKTPAVFQCRREETSPVDRGNVETCSVTRNSQYVVKSSVYDSIFSDTQE